MDKAREAKYCSLRAGAHTPHLLRNITLGDGFQFKHRNPRTFPIEALRMTLDAPRYVLNTVIRKDLHLP
jgi:hypothetical protein